MPKQLSDVYYQQHVEELEEILEKYYRGETVRSRDISGLLSRDYGIEVGASHVGRLLSDYSEQDENFHKLETGPYVFGYKIDPDEYTPREERKEEEEKPNEEVVNFIEDLKEYIVKEEEVPSLDIEIKINDFLTEEFPSIMGSERPEKIGDIANLLTEYEDIERGNGVYILVD